MLRLDSCAFWTMWGSEVGALWSGMVVFLEVRSAVSFRDGVLCVKVSSWEPGS